MKYDNDQIRKKIFSTVEENYLIQIKDFLFIPVGEESYSYMVDTGNEKLFVKYCAVPHIIKHIEKTSQLLSELSHLDFIVPPISIQGKTSFQVHEGRVYVYPYIEGEVVRLGNDVFGKELVSNLTEILAQMYKATASIKVDLPREEFVNTFPDRFAKLMNTVQNSENEVRELLNENEELIQSIITEYSQLCDKYREENVELVLTHGDVTGLNIIATENGVKLVDWDGAMFAPAERDINFLYDNPNFSLESYLDKSEKKEYNSELKEYYGIQWSLDSIIGNSETLLEQRLLSKADKEFYIEEINEYLGYFI